MSGSQVATSVRRRRVIGFFDDEETVLQRMQAYASEFDVLTTSEVEAVRGWVVGGEIDMLVSDYKVSYIDVMTFLEDLRDSAPNLAIIMTSAFSPDAYDLQRLRSIGAEFIPKTEQRRLVEAARNSPISAGAETVSQLQDEIERLKAMHRIFVDDLVQELTAIPDKSRPISLNDAGYTVESLIRDLEQQNPRAKEFLSVWVKLKQRLRKLGRTM